MHYDHTEFHLDADYPADLPTQNAAHHMGYYYAWAVSQNLHSTAAAALPDFDRLQNGSISGSVFVREQLRGGLDSTCFNERGNRFTAYYYDDEDEGYGAFLSDYFQALGIQSEHGFYRTEDSPECQARLNPVFQAAFEKWLGSLRPTQAD